MGLPNARRGRPKETPPARQRRLSPTAQPTSVEGRDNSYMDFSEETTAHFNEVARSMLTMGKGAPQRAVSYTHLTLPTKRIV